VQVDCLESLCHCADPNVCYFTQVWVMKMTLHQAVTYTSACNPRESQNVASFYLCHAFVVIQSRGRFIFNYPLLWVRHSGVGRKSWPCRFRGLRDEFIYWSAAILQFHDGSMFRGGTSYSRRSNLFTCLTLSYFTGLGIRVQRVACVLKTVSGSSIIIRPARNCITCCVL
jgi:hypothetical protein